MKIIDIIKKIFHRNDTKLLTEKTTEEIWTREEEIEKVGFKTYLNGLVYDFANANIENPKDTIINLNVYDPSKKDIVLFLYYVIATMTNQDYVDNHIMDNITEFNNIQFIENTNNYQPCTPGHNRKILENVRNTFAHKSGIVEYENDDIIISNSKKYGNNEFKFKIKIKEDDLIKIFQKSTSKHRESENRVIKQLFDYINNIEKGKIISNEDIGYVMLLNLIFSFNKESTFDKYMEFGGESLDLSSILVRNSRFSKDNDEFLNYFEINEVNPITMEEEVLFHKERLELAKKGINIQSISHEKKCMWNTKKMAFDADLGVHIPNEIVLYHMRNALSHGFLDIQGNKFNFWDNRKPKKSDSPNYFEFEIERDVLKELLKEDYFKEGLCTLEKYHSKDYKNHFYRTELSQIHVSFENFMQYYANRFPQFSKKQLIKYMYDNNKFSTYLFEHPDNIIGFTRYIVPEEHKLLVDCIKEIAGIEDSHILFGNPDTLYDSQVTGVESFGNYMAYGDLSYYEALLQYYKNRYSTQSIEEIKRECTDEEIKELAEPDYILSQYLLHNGCEDLRFAVVGNILDEKSEFDRIETAIIFHDKKYLAQLENKKISNNAIARSEEVYDLGSESLSQEKFRKYIEDHQFQKKLSEIKLDLGLYGISIIKDLGLVKNPSKTLIKYIDYLNKGNVFDKINAAMLSKSILDKSKKKGEDSNEIS